MPKNPSLDVVRRWRALDASLAYGSVFKKRFASAWGCSEKTIQRDIDGLRKLGQQIKSYPHIEEAPSPGWGIRASKEYYYCYARDQQPLFACNTEEGRKRLSQAEREEIETPPARDDSDWLDV
jgi:hypothetical protein